MPVGTSLCASLNLESYYHLINKAVTGIDCSGSNDYFAILFAAKFGNCLSAEFLNLLPCEGFRETVP